MKTFSLVKKSSFRPTMAQNFRKNIFFGLLIALAFSSTNCDVDIKVVLEQPITVPVSDVVATSLVLTFAPGEEGSPPHHHAGMSHCRITLK